MSLATPEKIRTLQRKLYRKAKAEPAFRFYLLYDKIYREDILRHAYALARANAGAPGTDQMTFAAIEALGLERWLAGLREELVSKAYRPDPVRRVSIPKPDGGERPLGIPTIRDRVVQTAAKLVLEPMEADLKKSARHSCIAALHSTQSSLRRGCPRGRRAVAPLDRAGRDRVDAGWSGLRISTKPRPICPSVSVGREETTEKTT